MKEFSTETPIEFKNPYFSVLDQLHCYEIFFLLILKMVAPAQLLDCCNLVCCVILYTEVLTFFMSLLQLMTPHNHLQRFWCPSLVTCWHLNPWPFPSIHNNLILPLFNHPDRKVKQGAHLLTEQPASVEFCNDLVLHKAISSLHKSIINGSQLLLVLFMPRLFWTALWFREPQQSPVNTLASLMRRLLIILI